MDQKSSVNLMDDVHLFISHKKEDQQCAEEIRNTLMGRTGRLKVHLFEDSLAGVDIDEWIKEHLSSSEILLFIYNDSMADWSWCFVEIGKYTELPPPRNVICICSETISWPAPLQGIQNVRAEAREIVIKFLDPLYRSDRFYYPKSALNESITDDQLQRIAEKIVLLMEPKEIKPNYYSERFLLRIDDIEKAKTGGIPDDARIQVNGDKSEIFDLHKSEFDWRTLMSRVPGGDTSSWARELNKAIKSVADNFSIPVQTITIRSSLGGDIFRPILYRVDRVNGLPRDFHILFVKELSPNGVGGPGALGIMFNLLRFANRYRYEVVRPALDRIDGLAEEEKEAFFVRIHERIRAVEEDAERHNLFAKDEIVRALEIDGDEGKRGDVQSLMDEWARVRALLHDSVAARNREIVAAELKAGDRIFGSLLEIGASRYSELIGADEAARRVKREGRGRPGPTARHAPGRRAPARR